MKEKETKEKQNKKIIILLIVLLLVIAGTTFALYTNTFSGTKDVVIDTNNLKFNYNETSNSITLDNPKGLNDTEGLTNGGTFTFDVSAASTKEQKVYYAIYLTEETTNTMYGSYVRIALLDNSGNILVKPTSYKNLGNIQEKENAKFLYKNVLNLPTDNDVKQNYTLKYWASYSADTIIKTTNNKKQTATLSGGEFKFKVNVMVVDADFKKTGVETLIEKVGTDGLVAESHPATVQLAATTAYRYTGANPNNYVRFNNELWRIIGVFDVDDGTGNIEKRIKIIRNKSIGNIQWDRNDSQNWTKATGMKLLNEGDYWNRTGSYASTGLTEEAKKMIDDAKWYLGGANRSDSPNVAQFYSCERGTTVREWNPTSWVGKVGLMYPSDCGYATSGNANTTRETCLAKEMSKWYDLYGCYSNDWLLDSSNDYQWTITHDIWPYTFRVSDTGSVSSYNSYSSDALRPTVYLLPDIQITEGNGSSTSPYKIINSSYSDDQPPEPFHKMTAEEFATAKVGTDGLVAETHPATEQLIATTAYRYTRANPDNYIKFNNETWRIIGVFDVEDGTGKLEKRIKIIRNKSIGNIPWDRNDSQNWTKATGMKLLNEGDYWNRTGSYASTGLTEEAKKMIDDAKWYLGGVNRSDSPNVAQFYSCERGTTVREGNPTSWVGKVGLMYPSDYGYATSGTAPSNSANTTRETCLAKEMFYWHDLYGCYSNDWLLDSANVQWTLTHDIWPYTFSAYDTGSVSSSGSDNSYALHPTIYLSSDIKITGGNGSSSTPYEISK